MSLTVLQKINIAKLSQGYALEAIVKGGLYGNGIDLNLSRKLYCIRKNVEWLYNLDSSDTTLTATSNYLISLCYNVFLANNNIPGGTVAPIAPTISIKSPIMITGSLFTSALSWDGINNDGINILAAYTLQVFWNGANKFLDEDVDWTRTSTGFDLIPNGITIPVDFDGTTTNAADIFFIFISV